MAYSRIKVWIPGEVLTANDLNAEFTGCVGNENDLLTRITNEATSRATADTILQTNIDTIYDSTAGEIEANLVVEDSIKADAVTVAKIKDAEITLAKMAASAKSPAAGTEGLRKLGTGALDAMPGNTAIAPPDGSITAAKLGPGAVEIAKILPPSAGTTHIIARVHQDAGVGVDGILGGAYIMLPGVITVYVQIYTMTGAISVFHNGVGVGSLAGVGVGWNDYTMNLTVSVGDVLTFTSTSGVQFRYLQIRSGVLTPAAVPYHRPGYTHMW